MEMSATGTLATATPGQPAELPELPELAELLDQLRSVSFPTLGHFLEEGFCSSEIHAIVPGARMVGIATTARIPDADAVAVNHALLRLHPGEVLVLDMDGDRQHAPVGAVTGAAARDRGAAGILVDGPVTDVVELNEANDGGALPVFARGTTCLTTKRHASGRAQFDVPVSVGGVTVRPGDIVLGDDNGVVVLAPEVAAAVVLQAVESDAAEPNILSRIAAGEPLEGILYLGQ
ncbi:RraA family protein [Arthrobacter crystallopoietes]|uniref:RraA family protein n=1 Tax=Crystallibacter crystallopoietes TaxID=37928 RepID=UPI001FC9EFF8|nr:RraA family protein [Arthrobacter crystallopoietes]